MEPSFNTASGMRSHVTYFIGTLIPCFVGFQYRKRYEVTCGGHATTTLRIHGRGFNTASGMRSHVTAKETLGSGVDASFNTASGMRSHVTRASENTWRKIPEFQYRKRYEVTCDLSLYSGSPQSDMFQYRKRYEVTCDHLRQRP